MFLGGKTANKTQYIATTSRSGGRYTNRLDVTDIYTKVVLPYLKSAEYKRGDLNALSDRQIRGMNTFARVGCIECHSGPMFSDYELHVMGVRDNNKLSESDDGDGNFRFRTPTLRNLNLTAPYMHNGEFGSLNRVLRFYDDNNRDAMNPNVNNNQLDEKLRDLNNINGRDRDDIISFLSALNDDSFDKTELTTVPSGLQPGGDID